ncbi:MAG: hypothetical protein R2710_20380 [Acidimicrobiales bacterium]
MEALDAHLAAVDDRNPAINVVVTLDAERARAEARSIDDRRTAGSPLGRWPVSRSLSRTPS